MGGFILTLTLVIVAIVALMLGIIENLRVMERVHRAIDKLEEKTLRLEKVEDAVESCTKTVRIEVSDSIMNYLTEDK